MAGEVQLSLDKSSVTVIVAFKEATDSDVNNANDNFLSYAARRTKHSTQVYFKSHRES
jgi:hypothetical protein